MARLYESMTRVVLWTHLGKTKDRVEEYVVRVWRECKDLKQALELDESLQNAIYEIWDYNGSVQEVIERILEIHHVNAVEVVDMTGSGAVVYSEWP
jgi:hypothetical protein